MDFEAAFARHYPPLFRYLHRLTGDADAAADMAQECFVRLLGSRALPEEKIRSWLFTVGTNLVRDEARARNRRQRLAIARDLAPRAPVAPDERVERAERVASIRRALDRLKPRDRALLLLREEGFRYAEIAEIVGVGPTSVGKLLTRALQRFERLYTGEAGASAGDARDEYDDRAGGEDAALG